MREKVKAELMKRAAGGRISCPEARLIAEDLKVAYAEVGSVADELGIKITGCELGCF